MRTLFLLRGAPASGKSTWIKENNLEPYTISTDTLRLMYQGPITKTDGTSAITQDSDKEVWNLVMSLLERRMENGEFIIVDATHYKSSLLTRYKSLIDKYRYRVYVIDFTNITEEELQKRNKDRRFSVPPEVISKQMVALKDNSEIKKSYKILTPEEAKNLLNTPIQPTDLNDKDGIVVFGDIHGCYDPLKRYFDTHPFNDQYQYIFTGDYIDRGIQNKEVLEFLLSIYKKPNVILLEGNHEKWLRIYTEDSYNIKDYEDREANARSIYFEKILNKLKDKKIQLTNKIKKNVSKAENLYKLLEEERKTKPETTEIYYEFNLIDVPQTRKKLFLEIDEWKIKVEKLTKFIYLLTHEEDSTMRCFEEIKEEYKEFFDETLNVNLSHYISLFSSWGATNKKNPIRSKEFLDHTLPAIEDLNKADLRQLCRKFSQLYYFSYKGQKYLVTHSGVPTLPTLFMSAHDIISGVGKYEDGYKVDETFIKNNIDVISIHGHRNIKEEPIKQFDGKIYNLESKVEFGGFLSGVEIFEDPVTIEIENKIFRHQEEVKKEEKEDIEILKELLNSPLITKKNLQDNIISFNFNRDAFYNRQWNNLTCTARGLFVDKTNGNVVAISYPKFFNYKEVDETSPIALQKNLKFPVVGYKKENGFLGLISKYNGKINFFTKSTDRGDYVDYFIQVLLKLICNKQVNYLNETVGIQELYKADVRIQLSSKIKEGFTYIFEVIDPDNDPHIIKYPNKTIYLLDIRENKLRGDFLTYDDVKKEAEKLGIKCKQKELVLNNWEEFETWKEAFRHGELKWDCNHEGYVLQDASGFRVKFKSPFYSFWKQMRGVKEIIQKGATNKKIYKTKQEIEVVKLLESINKDELKKMSIIDIQQLYDMQQLYEKGTK